LTYEGSWGLGKKSSRAKKDMRLKELNIVVTYAQFDSKICVLYVFLFFFKNTAQNTQSGKGYAKNHYRAATREPFC
jgi:hypothetical protein